MSTTPFLLCLCLWAAPPAADPPLAINGNPTVREHRIVRLTAANVPEGAALIWDVSDEANVDIEERDGAIWFVAPPGTYAVKLRAITFNARRATATARLLVTVEVAARPPPVKPDPIKPIDPVKPIDGPLYFAVVRPDGPASPEFVAAMSLPEWDALRKAGHVVKDFTPGRAAAVLGEGVVPAGTRLPCVVTLSTTPAGSTVLAGPAPLPTAGAGVLELVKAVRK